MSALKKPVVASDDNESTLLFEGMTTIGRYYRVTLDNAGVLRFYRDFDHAPGNWHLEGAVEFPMEGWQWALRRHLSGGEGLTYFSDLSVA